MTPCIIGLILYTRKNSVRGLMFFKKHHIVIIKDSPTGENKNFRLRLWFFYVLALCFLLLILSTAWLLKEYLQSQQLKNQLQQTQVEREEQNEQLLNLHKQIQNITKDFQRVERFDAKIRHMLDMNAELGAVDTKANEDFLNTSLPMHKPNLMARRMQNYLNLLAHDIQLEEVNQQDLLKALRLKESALSRSPSIWPVRGKINSSFGYRRAPFGGHRSFHKGIDIKGAVGAPVVASAAGTVKSAGYDGAYGIVVVVDHGAGIVTKYAHLQMATVKPGQNVKRGDRVGRVGMTGRTTGPHLHYEVVVGGVPRDPMKYILD